MRYPALIVLTVCVPAYGQIQPEPLGRVNSLPENYPPHWIIAHDAAFFHPNDGKFIVLDADSDDTAGRYKGMFNGAYVGPMYMARTRPEIYVLETFYSRGWRGERTDVITIYDKAMLTPIGEVVIPAKRAIPIPAEYYLQLVGNDRFALVYNFTPASSVTVVDVESREFRGEIPIPGCALALPMAGRAFASLCADGSMLSVQLSETGTQDSSFRTEPFFDTDQDPMMDKAAIIDGVAYFPTFRGNVHAVDLNGELPRASEPWSLLTEGDDGWRPGGVSVAKADADGRLYVLMHPHGYDGSHKDPGLEVWVFDPPSRQRVQRIELAIPAVSIGMTRDPNALMLATNVEMNIDVYNAKTGEHLRTLADFGQETPLQIYAAE